MILEDRVPGAVVPSHQSPARQLLPSSPRLLAELLPLRPHPGTIPGPLAGAKGILPQTHRPLLVVPPSSDVAHCACSPFVHPRQAKLCGPHHLQVSVGRLGGCSSTCTTRLKHPSG